MNKKTAKALIKCHCLALRSGVCKDDIATTEGFIDGIIDELDDHSSEEELVYEMRIYREDSDEEYLELWLSKKQKEAIMKLGRESFGWGTS